MPLFKDRVEAGKKLGAALKKKKITAPFVLALPRGGVVIGAEVAKILQCPLDVVISRKIGFPGHLEYGIGALSEDEVPLFNPSILKYFEYDSQDVTQIVEEEKIEMKRRLKLYRDSRPLEKLETKTVILVDDGLATGVTAAAAGKFLKKLSPKKLILAVPVGPREISPLIEQQFDEIFCLYQPINFHGVGVWFNDFTQVEDREVLRILSKKTKAKEL